MDESGVSKECIEESGEERGKEQWDEKKRGLEITIKDKISITTQE